MGWNNEIKKELGYCGNNVFIGHNTIFTNPSKVFLSDNVRIDPFCLITTQLEVGEYAQICSHAVLGGGAQHKITLGKWNFIGYGSKLFCASEDYSGEFGPVNEFWGNNKIFRGDITFNDYAGIASNVTLLPGIILPEGCTIGANSFVHTKEKLTPWSVYFGNPLEKKKDRFRDNVIKFSNDPEFLKNKLPKCAKIICTFIGKRRNTHNTPLDTFDFLMKNINHEIELEHGYNTDLIIAINDSGELNENKIQEIEKLNGTPTKNGKIIIERRSNTHGPFGAFYEMFLKYKDEYEYWFFSEDDVYIYKENYIRKFIDFINSDPKIGFVSLPPLSNNTYPVHSCGGAGLTTRENFEKINSNEFIKNFLNDTNIKNDYPYFESLEIQFTNRFIAGGFELRNHPEFYPVCENYNSVPSHKVHLNRYPKLEFIYRVGN